MGNHGVRESRNAEIKSVQMTSSEYEISWERSCIRTDFTSEYFVLGLVEESVEVFEACHYKRSDEDVVKECGDVLWYVTGLLRNHDFLLDNMVGSCFDQVPEMVGCTEPEVLLIIRAGSLAGRVKKYQRGDYTEEKLILFLRTLIPEIISALHSVCVSRGQSLSDAAKANVVKINQRLTSGNIMGDGSNR